MALGHDDFAALAEPLRRELQVYCYRMVGSLHDAEDLVQDVLVKAWRGVGTFRGDSAFRTWLYRIATNTCIDALRRRPRRILPSDMSAPADPHDPVRPDVADPIWLEPYPDARLDESETPEARLCRRESISLAFLAAIQYLTARQRAVLILRDVLGWSAVEVADALATSVVSVNSLLQRARAVLRTRYRGGAGEADRAVDERQADLLERYIRAWHAADIDGLVALLTEDAVMTMPPSPSWYQGRRAIGAFLAATLRSGPLAGRLLLLPARANRQVGAAVYRVDPLRAGEPFAIKVLTVHAGLVTAITGFVTPDLFHRFDLPARLAPPRLAATS
jgi:RNA polymerase sigma-70 factor (ECF subfamily)